MLCLPILLSVLGRRFVTTINFLIAAEGFNLFIRKLLTLVLLFVITGCSSVSNVFNAEPRASGHEVSTKSITVLDVRHQSTLDRIIPELIKHQVVLVGESHTSYSDHMNQLAVIKALHPHWLKMGIGLEFIQSPYQQALNEYIAGDLNDIEMLRATQWYKRWKYDFRLYRPIFHYAKKNKIPLIALNAPTELTKKISKVGISGLSSKDRRLLPSKIIRQKAYRDRLLKVFQQHSRDSSKNSNNKKLNNFVDVQLAWDESMAMNTAKAIHSNKINKMVLLAGSGHVVRQGIPVRLEKQLTTQPIIIVNHVEDDLNQVDYILQREHEPLAPAGKIGIMMKGNKNEAMAGVGTTRGVLVTGVIKKQQKKLSKGDLILSINTQNVNSPEDIKIILLDKLSGENIKISIQRGNQVVIEQTIKLL